MPSVRLEITHNALKDLKRLDKATARRILSKLEVNIALPDPLLRAKPLQGKLAGLYRYRVGNYRVIFSQDKDGTLLVYTVFTVKHRKDIYR